MGLGLLGFTRRHKRKGNVTTTHKPLKWKYLPDYKKFWDAFIDLFWGTNNKSSYHDMLSQDIDFLKSLYQKNDIATSEIEKRFGAEYQSASNEFAKDLANNKVDVMSGGRKLFSFVPQSTLRTAAAKESNAVGAAGVKLGIGTKRLERELQHKSIFTPNLTGLQYLTMLGKIGGEGQKYRMALASSTEKGKVPALGMMPMLGDALNLASTGHSVYDEFFPNGISGAWGKMKNFGSSAWGKMTNLFGAGSASAAGAGAAGASGSAAGSAGAAGAGEGLGGGWGIIAAG